MEKDKEYLEKWNQRIAGMSLEELLTVIMDEQDCYYAEFVRMARQKVFNDYRFINRLKTNEERLRAEELRKSGYDPSERIGTRELLKRVLDEIGCQFEMLDDDDICIYYQGERFFINPTDDCEFVSIYGCWVDMCELDDHQYIGYVKEAINTSNQNTFGTFFYEMDEAANSMGIRCCIDAYLVPDIPNIGNYLRSVFKKFFKAQRFFEEEMDRLWNNRNIVE